MFACSRCLIYISCSVHLIWMYYDIIYYYYYYYYYYKTNSNVLCFIFQPMTQAVNEFGQVWTNVIMKTTTGESSLIYRSRYKFPYIYLYLYPTPPRSLGRAALERSAHDCETRRLSNLVPRAFPNFLLRMLYEGNKSAQGSG